MQQSFQIVLMSDENPIPVQLPPFFSDYTIRPQDYIEIKRSLGDMFDAYIRSESYKSRDWDGEHAPDLFMFMNELIDNLFLANMSKPNTNVTLTQN